MKIADPEILQNLVFWSTPRETLDDETIQCLAKIIASEHVRFSRTYRVFEDYFSKSNNGNKGEHLVKCVRRLTTS